MVTFSQQCSHTQQETGNISVKLNVFATDRLFKLRKIKRQSISTFINMTSSVLFFSSFLLIIYVC